MKFIKKTKGLEIRKDNFSNSDLIIIGRVLSELNISVNASDVLLNVILLQCPNHNVDDLILAFMRELNLVEYTVINDSEHNR